MLLAPRGQVTTLSTGTLIERRCACHGSTSWLAIEKAKCPPPTPVWPGMVPPGVSNGPPVTPALKSSRTFPAGAAWRDRPLELEQRAEPDPPPIELGGG